MTFAMQLGQAAVMTIMTVLLIGFLLDTYHRARAAWRRRAREQRRRARRDIFEASMREFHDLLAYAEASDLPMVLYGTAEGAILRIAHTHDMSVLPPCGRCHRQGWERFKGCFCPSDDLASKPTIDVWGPVTFLRP